MIKTWYYAYVEKILVILFDNINNNINILFVILNKYLFYKKLFIYIYFIYGKIFI